MNIQEIEQELNAAFAGQADSNAVIIDSNTEAIDPWLVVNPVFLVDVCAFLRDTPGLEFDHLNDLCGVDYLETNPKKLAKFGHDPHVEVVYHLSSVALKHRIKLKVLVSRWKDDQANHLPEVPSISRVWKIAEWHEREAYDLAGIHFTGHPNLTRILCPEDWVGHALRKDYDFPLEYHGVRAR